MVLSNLRTEKKLVRGQYVAAATGFTSLFSLIGIMFYGLPFFYDYLVKDFGWSRTVVTSGAAVGRITMCCFGFFAGWLVDRYGPRRMIFTGILLGALGIIGISQMVSLLQFYLFNLVAAAGYIFGGPLPNQVLMSNWFTTSRGKAMGVAYLGVGVGGVLVPQISKTFSLYFNWHLALCLLGCLMIVVALPFAWLTKEKAVPVISKRLVPRQQSIRWLLRNRHFYLLLIGSVCSIAAVSGTSQHLKLFFSLDLHFSQMKAANLISLVLLSSIVGRLLIGWLADRVQKKWVMVMTYALVAGSISLLYFWQSSGVLYVFSVLFGMGLGGDYMVIPLMAAELFGVRMMGRVMGLILSGDVLADALTPVLVGRLHDLQGHYMNAFAILILLGVLGMIAVLFLPYKSIAIETDLAVNA